MTTAPTTRRRRDSEIKDDLRTIEAAGWIVCDWEREFVAAVLWRIGGRMTRRQRAAAERIVERYLPEPRRPEKRTISRA